MSEPRKCPVCGKPARPIGGYTHCSWACIDAPAVPAPARLRWDDSEYITKLVNEEGREVARIYITALTRTANTIEVGDLDVEIEHDRTVAGAKRALLAYLSQPQKMLADVMARAWPVGTRVRGESGVVAFTTSVPVPVYAPDAWTVDVRYEANGYRTRWYLSSCERAPEPAPERDSREPLSDDEIRELLTSTLHGSLPRPTMLRVFATLAEVPSLRQAAARLREELCT